jgi:opacity protein-like surface antigen
MRSRSLVIASGVVALCVHSLPVSAQDERAQYPRFLANSYIGLNVGYIDYSFSASQLTPGFNAQSIRVPHLAARVFLFGHEFNKYFSGQVTYLRPVAWVRYENVNSDRSSHSVWMDVAGLTMRSRLPLTEKVSVYGEGGLGLITRKGFDSGGVAAVKDAEYAAPLLGGGVAYNLNSNWSVNTGITFSPEHHSDAQPATSFLSMGFHYTMRPLPPEQVEKNVDASIQFPKNIVQLGYITNRLGYGVNDFVSRGAVPVFWSADVQSANGVSLNYQHNAFHTRSVFSLDWGIGISSLKSDKNAEPFVAASFYPLLRFTLLRTTPADLYFDYSLAGPTLISRTSIDGKDTGRHFTFQDFMGVGLFTDHRRRVNAEIRIAHYSNGNLFPRNPGVTVPIGFNLGYTF